jgi:signal transduction histidine kinase
LENTLDEIKSLVVSTGVAARYCIDKQTNPLEHDLAEEMKNLSRRILADIQWDLEFVGEEHLRGLHRTFTDDLFLFYKECLVNISRHSMATRVEVLLQADLKSITLKVADNGRGLGDSTPKSLKRRARLLGGRMAVHQGASSGSTITLTLRRPRAPIFSRILQPRKPSP